MVDTRSLMLSLLVLGPGLAAQGGAPPTAEVQAREFEARRPPGGIVRDPAGRPIADADVWFRIEWDNPDAVHWRNHTLRHQPLPRVRSGRDGEFFVPLTSAHRLFTRQSAGRISLVVEKEGFHPWVEPLTTGLRGYLGSDVLLRPVTPAEQVAVVVDAPRPGMLLRVHRFTSKAAPHLDYEKFHPVPATGKLSVAVPFVPTPLTLGTLNNLALPVGIELQLIHPERTSVPVRIGFGQRTLRFDASVAASAVDTVCSLARADGKPLVRPRGLYRAPDGIARWFPVDPERVVESAALTLVAVDDEGCLAVNVPYVDPSIERIRLQPLPEAKERILRLLDSKGAPVTAARAEFFDLEALPRDLHPQLLTHLRARRRLTVADGRLDLTGVRLPGPGFLVVHGAGLEARLYFEPRGILGIRKLDMGRRWRHGSVELTVTDEAGVPVRGAFVIMNSRSFSLGAFQGRAPRTDQGGRVRIDLLRTGSHALQIHAPGVTQAATNVVIRRPGDVVKKSIVVSRTVAHPVVLVDEEKRPVPFAPVRVFANANNPNAGALRPALRTNSLLCSDSRGRILVMDFPRSMAPQLADLFGYGATPSRALDGSERIAKIEVGRTTSIALPLPDAEPTKECFTFNTRPVTRTIPKVEGAALVLARFPTGMQDGVLHIYLDSTAPLRVTADLLAAAMARSTERPIRIDQRAITRRVQLAIQGLEGVDVDGFRVETSGLNFRGGKPYLYGDTGLRLKPVGGLWELGLRDSEAFTAWILHPGFLTKRIEIPKAQAGERALSVELERGCGIEFRVQTRGRIFPTSKLYLNIHSMANELLLYQQEMVGDVAAKLPDGRWRVRAPAAVPPGQYRLTLRIVGTSVNMSRRAFTVKPGEPLVLDVMDRTVKIVGK